MAGAGWYYEDFNVGDEWETAHRLVSMEDIEAFAHLTGDTNPLHLDDAFAKKTPYGARIAHGLLGLSAMIGLFESLGLFHGTAIAFLGIERWRFRAPIFVGDSIHARMSIADKRLSRSDPGRGILVREYELINQHDVVVQDGRLTLMVKTRP